eukprot:1689366-Prymnesium_polylepis.1
MQRSRVMLAGGCGTWLGRAGRDRGDRNGTALPGARYVRKSNKRAVLYLHLCRRFADPLATADAKTPLTPARPAGYCVSVKTGEWIQPSGAGCVRSGRVQRTHPVRVDEHTGMIFAQVGGGELFNVGLASDKHNLPLPAQEPPRSTMPRAMAARKRQAVAAVSRKVLCNRADADADADVPMEDVQPHGALGGQVEAARGTGADAAGGLRQATLLGVWGRG